MPSDTQLLQLFLENQVEIGTSPRTIRHRRLELDNFLEGLDSFDVTTNRIQKWLDSRAIGVSTKRTYLRHYSAFYRWAIQHNYLRENPAAPLIPAETRTRLQVPSLTIGDVERVMSAAKDAADRGSPPGAVRCWIALAALQGMAVREIADLTAEDIDFTRHVIRFHSDSPFPRSEILHPLTIAALKEMHPPTRGPLFPDNDADQVSKTVIKYLHQCGINTHATGLTYWHYEQIAQFGKRLGRGPDRNFKFDESGVDRELWQHIERYVNDGDWGAVAFHAEKFTEDRVRQWAKLPANLVGVKLMKDALGERGVFQLGMVSAEREGWLLFAMGITMALRNADAHRIQDDRSDLRPYAVGVVGACSLLITQLRFQYGDQIGGTP